MKTELPLVAEFDYQRGDIFVIAFIYPATGKPFMLKGGSDPVNEYLINKMKCSYIVHYSRHRLGRSWHTFSINNLQDDFKAYCLDNIKRLTYKPKSFSIYDESFTVAQKNGRKITVSKRGERVLEKVVRRMPRSFPKELLPFAKL